MKDNNLKICNVCLKEKPRELFYKHSTNRLRPECKVCSSRLSSKRYQKRVLKNKMSQPKVQEIK